MTLHCYRVSAQIAARDEPFYALVMAAMRKADTDNAEILRQAFPEVHAELRARYDAPGGVLPGEPGYAEIQAARAELRIA